MNPIDGAGQALLSLHHQDQPSPIDGLVSLSQSPRLFTPPAHPPHPQHQPQNPPASSSAQYDPAGRESSEASGSSATAAAAAAPQPPLAGPSKKKRKVEGETPLIPGVRQTQRAPQSCLECSRRKIKCDRKVPCRPCLARGEGHECKRETVVVKGKLVATTGPETNGEEPVQMEAPTTLEELAAEHALTQSRLFRLEKLVAKLTNPPSGEGGTNASSSSLVVRPNKFSSQPPPVQTASPNDSIPIVFEEIALGIGKYTNVTTAADHPRHQQHPLLANTFINQPQQTGSSPAEISLASNRLNNGSGGFLDVLDTSAGPSLRPGAGLPLNLKPIEILRKLPEKRKADALVQSFADDLTWLNAVVHIPTFLRDYETLWRILKAWDGKNLDELEQIDPWHQAVLFSMLSTTGYLMDESQAILNSFKPGELQKSAQDWFDAAIQVLYSANFMSIPKIESIQAIIILSHAFHFSGGTSFHPTFFGVAEKLCYSLGLNTLGSEQEKGSSCSKFPYNQEGPPGRIAREVGRRIWWSIVESVWLFLPITGHCSIHPNHFNTSMPSNIGDDALCYPNPQIDEASVTEVSVHISSCKSAQILYDLLGTLRPSETPSYEAVLRSSARMDEIIGELPPELHPLFEKRKKSGTTYSSGTTCQRRYLAMRQAHRKFTVHRTYFGLSLKESQYSKSRAACVEAAETIISNAEQGLPAAFYRTWPILIWLIAAGIVLCFDLLQPKGKGKGNQSNVEVVKNLVKLLLDVGDTTGIASRGVSLIEGLLSALDMSARSGADTSHLSLSDLLDIVKAKDSLSNPSPSYSNQQPTPTGSASTPVSQQQMYNPSPMPQIQHDPLKQQHPFHASGQPPQQQHPQQQQPQQLQQHQQQQHQSQQVQQQLPEMSRQSSFSHHSATDDIVDWSLSNVDFPYLPENDALNALNTFLYVGEYGNTGSGFFPGLRP